MAQRHELTDALDKSEKVEAEIKSLLAMKPLKEDRALLIQGEKLKTAIDLIKRRLGAVKETASGGTPVFSFQPTTGGSPGAVNLTGGGTVAAGAGCSSSSSLLSSTQEDFDPTPMAFEFHEVCIYCQCPTVICAICKRSL